jgi:hypothetical protein
MCLIRSSPIQVSITIAGHAMICYMSSMTWKKPPLYSIWAGMRSRCRNPNARSWPDYGGRGITFCSRWDSYDLFVQDMGERPPGATLDRVNNDGPYSPENCRWATRKEQARNQRVTRYVMIEGLKYRAADLAELSGLKTDTIVERAQSGMTYEQVISPDRHVFREGLALGGKANGLRQQSKTHCPKGHAFDAENTAISPEGWRRCRRCRADRQLDYLRRKSLGEQRAE